MQHGRLGETENNDPGWKQAEPCQLAPKDLRSQFCHDGISSGVHQEEAGQPLPPNRTLLPSTPTICDESLKDRHSGVFFLGGGVSHPSLQPPSHQIQITSIKEHSTEWKSQAGKVGNWRQQGEERKTEENRERGSQQAEEQGGGLKV